jgi:hypothetical protein
MPLAYNPTRAALYHPEHGDTIFRQGRAYSAIQLAVEAARLAYYRAEETPHERARLGEALARVGFTDLTLFGDARSGAAAFAARRSSDGIALVSFRGTQPDDPRDLKADLRANLVPWPETGGRAHGGFADDTLALKSQILDWIETRKPDAGKLILTGHSLGAAMATLAATIWPSAWLVTIGSPRVGDAALLATIKAAQIVRFVDCCDVVTEVPPELGGYTHIRACRYLTRDGAIVENPDQRFMAADRVQANVEYLLRHAWRFWSNVFLRGLADHAPVNYLRAVFEGNADPDPAQ